MKHLYLLCSIFIVLFDSSFAQSKINIAVMDLSGEGLSISETKIISSRLRTDLFNTDKFIVVEREKMDDILNEQGFQLSGCTSNECVVEAGKLLGVQYMIAGDIGKIGDLYTITIRMIDVQSGKIIRTATEDCKCKIEDVLVKSVKNVAQILSGQKVQLSNYNKENAFYSQGKTLSSEIQPWEKLGLKREEYISYKRSGKSFTEWKNDFEVYKENIKNPFTTALKSAIFPGWGQLTMNKYRGYLYIAYDVIISGVHVYYQNTGEREYAKSIQLPVHLLVNRLISSIDAGITSIYYNKEKKQQFLYGLKLGNYKLNNESKYWVCFTVAF